MGAVSLIHIEVNPGWPFLIRLCASSQYFIFAVLFGKT